LHQFSRPQFYAARVRDQCGYCGTTNWEEIDRFSANN